MQSLKDFLEKIAPEPEPEEEPVKPVALKKPDVYMEKARQKQRRMLKGMILETRDMVKKELDKEYPTPKEGDDEQ